MKKQEELKRAIIELDNGEKVSVDEFSVLIIRKLLSMTPSQIEEMFKDDQKA